jgi:hypothetical protein
MTRYLGLFAPFFAGFFGGLVHFLVGYGLGSLINDVLRSFGR